MPKKIYRMNLKEFKQLMLMALNEGIEELSDESEGSGQVGLDLDEGIPPLTPQQRKRFEELKSKKVSSSLSTEEKKEYLSLLQKDVGAKSDAGKQRTDSIFSKLPDAQPTSAAKAISENFGQQTPQVQGSAGKKLQTKMDKVSGLEQIIGAVKQKGDAAVVLKDLAQQIGGDKLPADQILARAYSLAKKEK